MSLPTYKVLGAIPPTTVQVPDVAEQWLSAFSSTVAEGDIPGTLSLFIDDCWWRDLLSMTWDFRTFHGPNDITKFLGDRLCLSKLSTFNLSQSPPPIFVTPYPDLGWIQVLFTFETAVGHGTAVVRLVYLQSSEWKAFTLVTMLDSLKHAELEIDFNYPERLEWAKMREEELAFAKEDPPVLIVGAGQSGLGLAARLKALGVQSLVLERHGRIGDQWRKVRYASLRVHDVVWRNHLPLFPFPEPPLWPVFTPGVKIADWFESYVQQLDLNVWTSSTIRDPRWDPAKKEWSVKVVRGDGSERHMKIKHIVWATGLSGSLPKMPDFDGMDTFEGPILHSTRFHTPTEYRGKKVVVIGAGVSGHDICRDLAWEGIDVTMIQRSSTYVMSVKNGNGTLNKALYWKGGPPTELADILSNSLPNLVAMSLSVRNTVKIAELDKELLDGLHRVGFRTNAGFEGAGVFRYALKNGGGNYVDVGASQMIIDGKIKLKNDSLIDSFTKIGIKFTDGSELPADIIFLATGYGDIRATIRETFGGPVYAVLKDKFWEFDADGEWNGIWRDSGHEGLYVACANFPMARFFSKFLALQIKAMEMGVFGTRYSINCAPNAVTGDVAAP